jgi:hypothetical protein
METTMQFLFFMKVVEGTPMETLVAYAKDEVAKSLEYYLDDRIRLINYFADLSGAVLIYEADSLDEAKAAASAFPMAQAGIIHPEVIPLKPYGWDRLLT